MKAQILEELIKSPLGSSALLHFILIRVVKAITGGLISALLFCLIVLENYAWLFLLIGATSGFMIFLALRFFENRFGESQEKEDHNRSPEVRNLAESEEIKQANAVED